MKKLQSAILEKWFFTVVITSVFILASSITAMASVSSLLVEGFNNASDENRDYLIDRVFTVPGQIDVGDSLRGSLNFNTLNSADTNLGANTGNDELSGIYQVLISEKLEVSPGFFLYTFVPDPDFVEVNTGLGGADGVIMLIFEDSTPDFAADFDNPGAPSVGPDDGTVSRTVPPSSADVSTGDYDTEEAFIATATDGTLFAAIGFLGLPGEGAAASTLLPGFDNILGSFTITSSTTGVIGNFGLNIIELGPAADGQNIARALPSGFGGNVDFTVSQNLRGVYDLDTPFEASSNTDISFFIEDLPEYSCRVTAGGNRDGYTVPCETKKNGMPIAKTCVQEMYDTWGGQAGAQPGVDGNWTHHHFPTPKDSFLFHSNDLFYIACSDPGACVPAAANADNRQIDFAGVGKIRNVKGEYGDTPYNFVAGDEYCFEVHLEDIGEPGPGGRWPNATDVCTHCPGTPINEGDCVNCTDYYEIKIFNGANHDETGCLGTQLYVNGPDPASASCGYDFEGYFIRTGNVQMHPENN